MKMEKIEMYVPFVAFEKCTVSTFEEINEYFRKAIPVAISNKTFLMCERKGFRCSVYLNTYSKEICINYGKKQCTDNATYKKPEGMGYDTRLTKKNIEKIADVAASEFIRVYSDWK